MISAAEKKQNFERAYRKRTKAIIQDVQKLKNLKNGRYYCFDKEEIAEPLEEIREALNVVQVILEN